jgi:DNA mismatch repair ATPase MutS
LKGLLYEKKEKRFKVLLERQKQTINFISMLRLIVFLSGAGFTVYMYLKRLYYASAGIFIAAAVGFVFLAIKHSKIIDNKNLTNAIHNINEASLKRVNGEWKLFQDKGEEFKDNEHNYSDDLDIFGQSSVFQWINTAITNFGRNRLKEYLTNPVLEKEDIIKRQLAIAELSKALSFRQRFQAEGTLNLFDNKDSSDLIRWAENLNESVGKFSFKFFLYVMPVLTAASAIYYLINLGKTYVVPLIFIIINMGLIKFKGGLISSNLDTVFLYKKKIRAYTNMIRLIERKRFKSTLLNELKKELYVNHKEKASEAVRKLSIIADKISDRANVYSIVLNLIYLRDFQLLVLLNNWKKQYGRQIETWLKLIGEFEALASLSIINYDNPRWTIPKIEENSLMVFGSKTAHPLLQDNAVANDIRLGGKNTILLITGSNMSGKSTYLRTVGTNLVLAYSGASVCAESFTCSLMDIYTCMRIGDNLEKSISSFYAEIIRIKSIVKAADTGKPTFFLLDEIFKGTNSIDRHLGAQTLINELSEKNTLGLVSTHDLELGSLEETNKKIKNFNFQEYYINDEIKFDYKLREGVSRTRNAIYLMKLAGIKF